MTARVLIIAGSDSGGGAGIQADIKTVTMLGGHAMTAIAAITAQNTMGVQGVHAVPAEMVLMQIDSVAADIGVDAVKIGMIGSAQTAAAVADRLARPDLAGAAVVFDPVMVATSGSALADAATIRAFEALLDRATVATPNRDELAALGGEAAVLAHGCALLAKGGHGDGDTVTDRLIEPDAGEVARWEAPRIDTPHTHGTGCTLASAIATGLAQGMPLEPAIARARDFVRLSLLAAPGLGEGHGPMGQQAVRNDGLFTGPALNQFMLPARDYAASVAFYKLMGLTQIVDSPANGYARFEAVNGVTLSIHVGETAAAGGATAYLESGALDAWVAYLARRGVRFDHMPRDEEWGWREARLTDPAGNSLCLYQAGEYRRYPPWRL
ncbi:MULTISPECIES: bifunctional hydroxymethylpyrimidine kinase/phosphomethylpyrimidine kinase [Sphingopyxis]|uniref:bifunctional hydroxymethylpyrimidine kinase/phosphomethylpyrimidine kinase n=1 Tax=Sphingopyxis TaxID=165697 RepID=UPI00086ED110|nr:MULTISPECIES: bifunctional hydroxymethylpyrimidine kinase/phosphomethylpyrimidine kinase [Sphingopyxis]APW72629.1 bifunctional hydroxymethylpyrimidine kinase/phosphomethylpyrimidine kinase [Sphingopyxis granuli]AVA13890.1 bifunctional hydroxymethylpyrimidine kinase/phosphomethylpyrimidine kinase [Sphingopyxis sp. MG]ODU29248.1 MAG: bifunctional hydroxymethylpyrimidine kinase/phosphomethylpyrimidine kinase [Sphingopyxis sp. SCN 67-31]